MNEKNVLLRGSVSRSWPFSPVLRGGPPDLGPSHAAERSLWFATAPIALIQRVGQGLWSRPVRCVCTDSRRDDGRLVTVAERLRAQLGRA
jgi:hypothetical protein